MIQTALLASFQTGAQRRDFVNQAAVTSSIVTPTPAQDGNNHHDEEREEVEPPSYASEAPAPAYAPPTLATFGLRQTSRNHQTLVPFGRHLSTASGAAAATTSAPHEYYEIRGQDFTWVSKARADLLISRVDRSVGPGAGQGGWARRASVAVAGSGSAGGGGMQQVATARFARSGPLPWRPRASVGWPGGGTTEMGHDDEGGWRVEGRGCAWRLEKRPFRLELVEDDDGRDEEGGRLLATFVYSAEGTYAKKGGAVGMLKVWRYEDRGEEEMEVIVCTLMVVITYWRNEGKVFLNVGDGVGIVVGGR